MTRRAITVTPSAKRLVTSLRDIGYDAPTAVADLVDNSVSAGSRHVEVLIRFRGRHSQIVVKDDGHGMTEREMDEALRFGTRRSYDGGDLGRFGLGMKTASLSLGRRVTVVSRRAPVRRRIASRSLDLDHIATTDQWEILDAGGTRPDELGRTLLRDGPGTAVVIDRLDRVLPNRDPESGHAQRRLRTLEHSLRSHLAAVFHRFLEREGPDRLVISVNGDKLAPWNPFAPDEPCTQRLPARRFELVTNGSSHTVTFTPYILPPRSRMSSPAAFERLGGSKRWNRQQGLYVYRADRLVQSGGWCGLRAIDEHTKLARAALDFGTELDHEFRINVAKMRVALPAQLRSMLERPVNELCAAAGIEYRRAAQPTGEEEPTHKGEPARQDLGAVALHLLRAAQVSGHLDALTAIMAELRRINPPLAAELGW